MKIRTEFPRAITVHQGVRIPLSDGRTLAATIWMPTDADADPVPALLEYLPYRHSDWTAPRDAQRHPWYAGHGYASVRVDMRGSGNSDGVMLDEYDGQEQEDGLEVIAWLADQRWCTGSVGMFGISWGGFNSLQIAARRPEALKAIVTVCSTDDRYADDVHYFGGALLGIDMSAWAGTMLAFQARPPDPLHVGSAWRELWRERLEALRPFTDIWMAHQERDAYWRPGSVCEDYGSIAAAVLAVGGWADPYRNAVLRLLEHLDAPAAGIIGPWSHQYPDVQRTPGPTIGFLQETLRWWDHWLKGNDTGVMDEPRLRVYHQETAPPATHYPERAGRWIGLDEWPARAVTARRIPLESLTCTAAKHGLVTVRTPQHTGMDAGRWFPFGNRSDLPPDQREEDGRSVLFDSEPLTESLHLLGFMRIVARVAAESPRAHLIARLCDVAPDGSSTLITRGAINLVHRNGMDRADDLPVGDFVDAELEMVAISWAVPPGHRLRVAISDTYWPWVWPHPVSGGLVLDIASTVLVVDELDPTAVSPSPVVFEESEQAQPLAIRPGPVRTPRPERLVSYEPDSATWTLEVDPNYGGTRIYPDGLHFGEEALERYRISGNDPQSATAESSWTVTLDRDDWHVHIDTALRVSATATAFHTEASVRALDDGDVFFERTFTRSFPRTSA